MKRSEVLAKIADLISNEYRHTQDKLFDADLILTRLERIGMLPPTWHWQDSEEYGPIMKALNSIDVLDYGQPEWEPEDAT